MSKFLSEKVFFILILILGVILRFYQLGSNPVSLYWDEAAIGLDAYSLASTGKDINNMSWFQPVFGSYGDFKAPIYTLITTGWVKIFGLSNFSVRLTSAVFSSLSLILIYFLAKQIILLDKEKLKNFKYLPIISMFLMAVSPWPVHFGRIGFESSLSLFFYLGFLIFFIKAIISKSYNFFIASIFAVLGIYSYFSLRAIIPAIILLVFILFFKKIKHKLIWLGTSLILLFLCILPIFTSPYYQRSQEYRVNGDNLVTSEKVILESSQYLEKFNSSFFSKITYHRHLLWLRDFSTNFFSHFSFDFLFFSGDSNLRQHSGYMGEFFWSLLIFYVLGLIYLFNNINSKASKFLLILGLTAPIASSMTYEVPHASRAIYLLVFFIIIFSLGINLFINFAINFKYKKLILIIFIAIFSLNFIEYYFDYFKAYKERSSGAWLYQYNQVAEYIKNNSDQYREIKIFDQYWFPEIFIYYQYPEIIPQYQSLKNALLNDPRSSFGMPDIYQYILDKNNSRANKIASFIPFDQEIPEGYIYVRDFNYLNGEPCLILVEKTIEN